METNPVKKTVFIPRHYAFGYYSDGRLSSEIRTVRRDFSLVEANERCSIVFLTCTNEGAHTCGKWCESIVVQVDPNGRVTRLEAAKASHESIVETEEAWNKFINS